jgi:NAD+ kinase
MKIALFGNPYQEKYKASLNDFVSYLQEASDLMIEKDFRDYLESMGIDTDKARVLETGSFSGAELAVSIGGDGTLLSKAALLARQGIPVVGINTGHLGYLAACRLNEAHEMIESIKHGDCRHEERTMLQLVSINGEPCDNIIALNEIAILRQDTTSMISMPTTINGTMLTTYMGDGLVISTPTGSTAYNMSVGGPIMMPLTSCLALSPISPHSLTMRPIVVSDNSEIVVTINTRAQWIQVSVDGMAMTLPSGSTVKIAQAPYKLSVIQKKEHNFANTLREKLLWGADQR